MRQPNGDVTGPLTGQIRLPVPPPLPEDAVDDAGERLALGEQLVLLPLELGEVLVRRP